MIALKQGYEKHESSRLHHRLSDSNAFRANDLHRLSDNVSIPLLK